MMQHGAKIESDSTKFYILALNNNINIIINISSRSMEIITISSSFIRKRLLMHQKTMNSYHNLYFRNK